eukprot:CAMPEP_0172489450 /NCGR_PEP_ID=MMETSP1066-20121228/19462_1 /TAXON_ID=671091 /ORGANISM="Coscinodiscus wailesii, Strain CCMP2513" /LENGTH=194 /DNA_ID=CAMNT_0013257325 /DNA_START=27 /DNA_END=611 /DNA_ORIENTATION=+
MSVDTSLFTTEGVTKELNRWVVDMLYERGLPFVSSVDGRRFATEGELSQHLDKLFKIAQIEKTMEKTEERGWYASESQWTLQSPTTTMSSTGDPLSNKTSQTDTGDDQNGESDDPSKSTVPADENRSKCLICGIPFEMFFDQEGGDFMYTNCREIDVMNDDAAAREKEIMLVHETCRRSLGCVDYLTMDQVMRS